MAHTGWEQHTIKTIELYRDQSSVHTFPTLNEVRTVLGETFDEAFLSIPAYHLGERCPRFVLRPRSRRSRSFFKSSQIAGDKR
jgi:hypothetical protein